MRWTTRILFICTIAVFTAGCGNSDRPAEPTGDPVAAPRVVLDDIPPGTACMGDYVWDDLNCNGIQDDGEPGLGGVVVKLYECPSDALVDETVSEADGYYALFGPAPDDYYIVVDLPEGSSFSPANQGADDSADSDVNASGVGFCTNLHDQEVEKDMDVGICREETGECPTTIGDRVWFDVNCNGIQDENEFGGPAGLAVDLVNCDTGAVVASTTTDGNGYYLFSNAPEGSYKVCFELPDGYEWTAADQGASDVLDSDAGADGCTPCFVLECDKPNLRMDAGLCEKKGGGEGCTPGFWRNHLSHWDATGYSPDMVFDDVFGCEIFGDDTTLGWAVDNPGTLKNLAFHGVAALLNASHPDVDFDLTVDDVIDAVCDGDKDTLEEANESGCPLSGGNTTGGGGGVGGSNKKGRK